MNKKEEHLGQINVANDVIADLAGHVALESYGIAGMASPSAKVEVAQILTRDKLKKGVNVKVLNDKVEIDLYIIIEHGTNLSEVARNLVERVKYEVEKYVELEVDNVEIHIQRVKTRK
ncbi:Asp23/Gls24 family envelope stress response protein [Candidatus Oleimmundimicrobium sp.]|uniref:Asp23/Gls24 family envelope stress response protein n=1 Tax=Candidatus Oleimmundimicrobium sp. TaxID=3060597 RepID=UPI00271CD13F|nr:Asp23/Gls24 family envelope stress response protein [Candidatus Oleimmundimicrobium sp.]MDO8885339.1 Asp23/Gls24 family envelope stress response protein [Candidatus Oleimmundimicrobium sp.]